MPPLDNFLTTHHSYVYLSNYFKFQYIHHELMSPALREKTHLFNSFFYKALTQPGKKESKKDPPTKKLNASERMHQQVSICETVVF